ncbi:hypothetical protein [Pseudomonas gingeri]|uniref:hypothetical protein n=1 Tax=Pseudomonas gingeri TaxID=117681 RepID=UPI0015A13668|nr:hypothetical protein [Pseudomonas gingeri]NWA11962.1 hypothetical protein [Pseudomonas gingeri]
MSAARRKTLEEVLTDQVVAFSSSDRPAEIISTNVERMFSEVIREAFNPHGLFATRVKEEFAKALPANLSSIMDLPGYNDLVSNALKERWLEAGVSGDMLRRAEAAIDEVMHADFVPEYVSLTQLLEAFVEANQAKAKDKGWHIPHISIREGGGARDRYIYVYFDAEPETAYRDRNSLRESTRADMDYSNRLTVHITGHNDRGCEVGRVHSAALDGEPIGRNFSMKSRWQKLVAALYFGSSKLIIDCREEDFYYPL